MWSAPAQAGEVEVLHYWTSGSEAKALAELKKIMRSYGHSWRDFAVSGGGGDNASTVLQNRVRAGNPPAAAQMKSPALRQWAASGALARLDATARAEHWDTLLPAVVADGLKYQGHYVAVPFNVHRVNWMWANAAVLRQAGVAAMPTTWEGFFAAAEQVRAAGLIPLAHGGQSWQDFTTFETVALGVGGAGFYRDAFVRRDPRALRSATMATVLHTLRRLKSYTDPGAPGRDWHVATGLLIQQRAAFQFMADWAKGEFSAAGQQAGRDYLCAPAPGTGTAFTFDVDALAMFRLRESAAQKAQADLASSVMGSTFQEAFNLYKGSIPARLGTDMARFDTCAQTAARDFAASAKTGQLLPSVAHGMAMPPPVEAALRDAVSAFWNDDGMAVVDGVQRIATAVARR